MSDVISQVENVQKLSSQRLSHVIGVEMGIWRHTDQQTQNFWQKEWIHNHLL